MFFPTVAIYTNAALTESLSLSMTMLAVAPLILLHERRLLALALSGAGVGLAALLRPDALIMLVAALPLIYKLRGGELARAAAALFLGVALFVGPWALRNLVEFGALHLSDGMIDRSSHQIKHYQGFWRWMQTWSTNWEPAGFPQSCYYDLGCRAAPAMFRVDYFPDERKEVERLLELRAREGHSAQVSDGFLALARQRTWRQPFRVLIGRPLLRLFSMWLSPQDELVQNPAWRPWPAFTRLFLPLGWAMSIFIFLGTILGAALLWLDAETRSFGQIIALPILARSAVLAWSAFSLPRYLLGLYPLSFLAIACGTAIGVRFFRRRLSTWPKTP
jgi:hypothetical protein